MVKGPGDVGFMMEFPTDEQVTRQQDFSKSLILEYRDVELFQVSDDNEACLFLYGSFRASALRLQPGYQLSGADTAGWIVQLRRWMCTSYDASPGRRE